MIIACLLRARRNSTKFHLCEDLPKTHSWMPSRNGTWQDWHSQTSRILCWVPGWVSHNNFMTFKNCSTETSNRICTRRKLPPKSSLLAVLVIRMECTAPKSWVGDSHFSAFLFLTHFLVQLFVKSQSHLWLLSSLFPLFCLLWWCISCCLHGGH